MSENYYKEPTNIRGTTNFALPRRTQYAYQTENTCNVPDCETRITDMSHVCPQHREWWTEVKRITAIQMTQFKEMLQRYRRKEVGGDIEVWEQ